MGAIRIVVLVVPHVESFSEQRDVLYPRQIVPL